MTLEPRVAMRLFIFTTLVVIGLLCFNAIRHADEAERNLHASKCVSRAVELFVEEHSRWPHTWEKLIAAVEVREGMYHLPRDAALIRERVDLRFEVGEEDFQSFESFTRLIAPKGPCYQESLRSELRYVYENVRGQLQRKH